MSFYPENESLRCASERVMGLLSTFPELVADRVCGPWIRETALTNYRRALEVITEEALLPT